MYVRGSSPRNCDKRRARPQESSEEPQNDGGEGGTKISGTAGTARTGSGCVHGTAGTGPPTGTAGTAGCVHGTVGTGPPTGTADTGTAGTALYPDPDTAGISRIGACTAGEVGTSTDQYGKSLDIRVHLGHGMGPREHSNTSSALPRRRQGLLNSHRPGTKPMDAARFKFCAAG
eukprot:SAG31_NODE_2034_length_6611_cov_5.685964_6_plen_173_part_01